VELYKGLASLKLSNWGLNLEFYILSYSLIYVLTKSQLTNKRHSVFSKYVMHKIP
jgi:hypothetical protein